MHAFDYFFSQIPIIEYLEETRPGTPLLPKEAGKRAQVINY
jgi:glutathione S-transferase